MPNIRRPDYTQQWLFPPSLEELLPTDHPARFIREMLGQLDLASYGCPPPAPGPGQPAFAPEVLLGVWLYGMVKRIHSTRRLEAACLDEIGFLWLTGLQAPDHTTLWKFFHHHQSTLTTLFQRLVQVAVLSGQVGLALEAVDGTKLAGACSRHSTLHRERLLKQFSKAAQAAADAACAEIAAADATETGTVRLTGALAEATQRVDAIQAALAMLDAAETEHLAPTEPEARMMKLADGPCRMGYNAQVVADSRHGLLVGCAVVTAADDTAQLVPMLTEAEANTGAVAEEAVADGGYLSCEQLAAAEEAGYPVVVNLGEDPQQEEAGAYAKARFTYDAERDAYQCPQGEWLTFSRKKWHTQRHYWMRIYRCRCRTCPARDACTTGKRPREISRIPHEETLLRQRQKQQCAETRALLRWRKAIVERVFAHIKQHLGFRRFTVWGVAAVRTQWTLVCCAYNLQVLYRLYLRGQFDLTQVATLLQSA